MRLQGGPLAGAVEGVVAGLGLLYTRLAGSDGPVMLPNAVVLNVAVSPLTEPAGVELLSPINASRSGARRTLPVSAAGRSKANAVRTTRSGPHVSGGAEEAPAREHHEPTADRP